MNPESIFSSKTFLISSVIFIGSGAALLIYQQYMWSKRQKNFSAQIVKLKQKILQLEDDIKQIKESVTHSSSTDEMEDFFVDASDVTQEVDDFQDKLDSQTFHSAAQEFSRGSVVMKNFLARVDRLMEQGEYENLHIAQTSLTEMINKNPENAELQWRLAKSSYLLASEGMFSNPDKPMDSQKDLMQKAHDAAERAVILDNESGDAHKWLAIIIGSVTQFLPIQEQIKNAFSIKEHIQAAIKYKPTDALSHHMLGRWCYSVYMLTWVERKVASTLFAAPPTATLEEAMASFHQAEKLNPKSSIDNALFLAKSYIAQQDYKTAISWLTSGSRIPCSSCDDMKSQNEIQSLLTQYEAYGNS